ncbi:peptidase A4 family-domain-containing protein [Halenospora varia]|nr:peptidase A4 family-domain-containing protein [Halenospora varia]
MWFLLLISIFLQSVHGVEYPPRPSEVQLAQLQTVTISQPGKNHQRAVDNSEQSNQDSWAGAVINNQKGEQITWATGSFVLAAPSLPPNAQSGISYKASIWVGIDGANNASTLLQAGVSIELEKTDKGESLRWIPWYEWFPEPAINIELREFAVKGNDTVRITIAFNPSTPSVGSFLLENLSSKTQYGLTLTASDASKYKLIGASAEWIVEDFVINGKPAPFVDFNTIVFTNSAGY